MFNCSDFPWQLYVGKDFSVTYNVKTDLESCFSKKFDFIRVPLVHPRYSKHPTIKRIQPMTRSDACLTSHQWNNCIQGKCSENINPDHLDPEVRLKWEESMINEIRWGVHLGVNSIVLNCPKSKSSNFARILNQYLEKGFYYQKILIHVGVSDWENWNSLRLKCGPSTVLGVSLDINTELSVPETERWLGEPIHTIYFSRSVFITNKDNYPVLSKNLQIFVQRLFKIKANVVVGPCRDHEQIRGYICYLFKNQPPLNEIQRFSYDFWDVSQIPLQPLMHNLESATYEIFEKDPVKYTLYENAIYEALKNHSDFVTIMVVGAGRGPIVRSAIRASRRVNRKTNIYALDKNPNAMVTLYNLISKFYTGTEWVNENVKVIESDMRYWNPEEKADIIVSELLGSFGDNELEPECLECASKLLKPNGISIPSLSTNFVAPISTQKNWTNTVTTQNSAETPYVCMPANSFIPSNPVKCFEFSYPSLSTNHNRYFSHTFSIPINVTIHGFVGYFESVLYGDVLMSIRPETYSKSLHSWFPMYFPIKQGLYCENSDLEVNIWRCNSNEKVWYEWEICIIKNGKLIATSGIHNPNGKVYWIGKS